MNMEIMNDRTDHNRIAEQFAARLLAQCEPPEPNAAAKPKATRKPRAEAPIAATVVEVPANVVTPIAPEIIEPEPIAGDLEIFNCDQNSREWHLARMGIPTASNFGLILTPGKTKTEQKTRRTYMLKLAGERLTGVPMDTVTTRDMERGHLLEPEARDLYALQTGTVLERVGFIRNNRLRCGGSPDSLIGTDGGLEIKTKLPHLLLDLIDKDEFPEEHKAQVQGTMWLTGRRYWDLKVVACVDEDGRPMLAPNMPTFVKRVIRDEVFIANLAVEVERFNTDLDAIVADMQRRIEKETDGFEFAAKAA